MRICVRLTYFRIYRGMPNTFNKRERLRFTLFLCLTVNDTPSNDQKYGYAKSKTIYWYLVT